MSDLSLALSRDPAEYHLFQLLRLLELRTRSEQGQASAPIGLDEPYQKEFVEFAVVQTLSFSGSPVARAEIVQQSGNRRFRLHITGFGLTGASGVLPAFYTDMLKRRIRQKDTALRDLLDILNARSLSFLYRAWQKSRMPVTCERRLCLRHADERDHAGEAIAAYTGTGHPVQRRAREYDLESVVLFFSGFYAKRPRNAIALRSIASAILGVPVQILQFFGRWFELDSEQRNRLGQANMGLGGDFVIGNAVFDGNHSLRIRTDPVSFADFSRMNPRKPLFQHLQRVVQLYLGSEYVVDLQIVLKREEVPAMEMRPPERIDQTAALGFGLWVLNNIRAGDADEAVFQLIA